MSGDANPVRRLFGGLLAVSGGLLAALAGLCTAVYAGVIIHDGLKGRLGGEPLPTGVGQWLLTDLVVGGAPTLLGVGLLALGLRLRTREPGPPPIWHRIVGALLVLLGLGVLAIFIWQLVLAFQFGPPIADTPISNVVTQVVAGAVVPTLIAALMLWIGLTLTRPRK